MLLLLCMFHLSWKKVKIIHQMMLFWDLFVQIANVLPGKCCWSRLWNESAWLKDSILFGTCYYLFFIKQWANVLHEEEETSWSSVFIDKGIRILISSTKFDFFFLLFICNFLRGMFNKSFLFFFAKYLLLSFNIFLFLFLYWRIISWNFHL